MKKWQQKHLDDQNELLANSNSEAVAGFFVPTITTFCFFMLAGVMTADDSWGIIAAFGMTFVCWPILSLIFIIYYKTKDNKSRMKGAKFSFFASLVPIFLTVVFGGLLES